MTRLPGPAGFVHLLIGRLLRLGCLLSALTLFPASSGYGCGWSLALLASGASAAAMLMILLRFRFCPLP